MTHADITHCVHGKPYEPALRWLLSLGPVDAREYVRYSLFQASSVYSRVQATRLTTAVAAVWYPVTALNPSGFSPELVRSASTCMNSAFTRSIEIFYHPCPKVEMQQMTMNDSMCHDFEKLVLTLATQ